MKTFDSSGKENFFFFLNIVRKGETADNQHSSPFPTMISTLLRINYII